MDIKDVALKIARDEGSMRQIRHKGIDGIEYHFETDDELVAFAEALVAEIQRQSEPVAWVYYPKGAGEKYVTYTNPASFDLGKQADRIAYIEPLYTFPPSIEALEDKVAEAMRVEEVQERGVR